MTKVGESGTEFDQLKGMESTPPYLKNLFAQLERQEFYGSVELKFEAGRIVLIRKTETIKPNDHRNNRGNNCEHR